MCSKATLDKVLHNTAVHMKKIFGSKLKNVILYGSYARGDFDKYSDIDVMVLVDMDKYELAKYREQVVEHRHALDLEHNFDFLMTIMLQDEATFKKFSDASGFFKNILREGVYINA
ncbi:MAG: nucleotidyltransferase domain-containing protein [Clostridia bacterium]|nr:nucleotidyltransferase domain-containing protein [Clostridia bacterium]